MALDNQSMNSNLLPGTNWVPGSYFWVLFSAFVLFFSTGRAQNLEGSLWYFGDRVGMDFRNGEPRPLNNSAMTAGYQSVTQSDKFGNLLFYGNQSNVYGSRHSLLPNGSIGSDVETWYRRRISMLAVPMDTINARYRLIYNNFTFGQCGCPKKAQFDRRLNNNLGDINTQETELLIDSSSKTLGGFALVPQKSNFGYWIAFIRGHLRDSSSRFQDTLFLQYFDNNHEKQNLLKIKLNPIISKGSALTDGMTPVIAVSASGDKIAVVSGSAYNQIELGQLHIIDFDNEAGVARQIISISDTLIHGYGRQRATYYFTTVFFSPNSKLLYLTYRTNIAPPPPGGSRYYEILQFNLKELNPDSILNSKTLIYRNSNYNLGLNAMFGQTAPDGRIYVSRQSSFAPPRFHVIDCPDIPGTGCGFRPFAIDLGRDPGNNFPVFNQTLTRNAWKLQAQANRENACLGDTMRLVAYGAGATRFRWYNLNNNGLLVDTNASFNYVATQDTVRFMVIGFGRCKVDTAYYTLRAVAKPPRPVITVSPSTTLCSGDSATLTAPPGYRYKWIPWWEGTQSIRVRGPGKYTVQVATLEGCFSESDTVQIDTVSGIAPQPVAVSGNRSFCPGTQTSLTAAAPLPGHSLLWSTGDTSRTVNFSSPGNYWLRVINPAGCGSSITDTIRLRLFPEPLPPQISYNNQAAPDTITACRENRVTLSSSPFTSYRWNTGDTLQSISINEQGNYYLSTTDANGCRSGSSAKVYVKHLPQPPMGSISGPDRLCPGVQGVAYVVSVSAGSVSFRWALAGSGTLQTNAGNTVLLNAGKAGTITLKLVTLSSDNCLGDTGTYTIQVNRQLTPEVLADTLQACPEVALRFRSRYAVAGSRYTWQVSGIASITGQGTAEARVSWINPGTYTAQVAENNQTNLDTCFGESETIAVTVLPRPETPIISIPITQKVNDSTARICEGETLTLTGLPSGLPANHYRWTTGETGGSIVQSQATQVPIGLSLVNENNCRSFAALPVSVFQYPNPGPAIVAEGDTLLTLFSLSNRTYRIGQPNPGSSYRWEVTGGSANTQTGATFVVNWEAKPLDGRSIRVVETSEQECKGEALLTLPYNDELFFPNVVTRNSDGKNDRFEIGNLHLKSGYRLSIHNRWGKTVFNTDNYQNNWPGTGDKPGTYFYRLDLGGKVHQGWVEVVSE